MACDSVWEAVDRQWGWIIVFGVSLSNMIMDGFLRGFGVFFTAFLIEFGGTASATAMIYGLRNVIFVFLSPLAAGLGDRFSERALVMAGGVILSLAYVLNFFSPNLAYVIVVLGVVNGLGSVPIVTCLPTVIGKHFMKRRALATTIGYAGSGFGQLLIPHLIIYLIELYGVRGMMLIYGGMQLNNVVIGALFMPFEKLVRIRRQHGNSVDTDYMLSTEITISVDDEIIQDRCISNTHTSTEKKCSVSRPNNFKLESNGNVFAKDRHCEKSITQSTDGNMIDDERDEMLKEKNEIVVLNCNGFDSHLQYTAPHPEDKCYSIVSTTVKALDKEEDPHRLTDTCCCRSKCRSLCDFSLFLRPISLLYFIATGIACAGFQCQATFLVPRATEMGMSLKQAAIVLSISGGIDILGRIVMGVLADMKSIGPFRVMIIYTMIIGFANTAFPACDSLSSMIGYSVVFGIFGSGGHILITSTVVELEGREKLASGVGCAMFMQGLAGALLPPLMVNCSLSWCVSDSNVYCSRAVIRDSPSLSCLIHHAVSRHGWMHLHQFAHWSRITK